MNEMADERDRFDNQRRPPTASSSPLSSPCCSSTQKWLQVASPILRLSWSDRQMDEDPGEPDVGMQTSELPSSGLYEELFCTSQTSISLVPLTGALLTSSRAQSDVVKQGYLGKLDRNHRKYFVLRTGSHTGPSRLEWYKSQEKFTALEKSAGKAVLFGSGRQGVIYLRCCLGVSRIGSSRKGHTVALYAKDQTMVLVVGDQWEQEEWYMSIKKLMEEEQKDEEHVFDEEDDGYCTLPTAAFVKEVWPVMVKPRGLGRSKSLAGETRLCLTASALILVRVGACNDLPLVTIPLLSVRRFGHLDGLFFLELGRSAPHGPGEIWVEARDQGNSTLAQHIHEVVRETVRALRALPDFNRSPTSNHTNHSQLQTLIASKRCRPKYRDKQVNVTSLGSPLALPPRSSEIQTGMIQCDLEPRKPDKPEPESTLSFSSYLNSQSSGPETGSYMEMKMDHHLSVKKERENDCSQITMVTGDHSSVAPCRMEGWEPGEPGEQEVPGYMMMSPQVRHTLSVLPQDDYVTMTSPLKLDWPAYSSSSSFLQTSFSSSTSDSCSPVHPSHHQTSEHSQSHWLVTSVQQSETEGGQSQRSISCSTQPQDDARQEQKLSQHRNLPSQTRASSSTVGSVDGSGLMIPLFTGGQSCSRPVQASPHSGSGRSKQLQDVPDQCAVRRYRLLSCLPSCLQATTDPECV
ncbi:insulin receptor substrate 1-like isoform X1 [Scomber scombrus]